MISVFNTSRKSTLSWYLDSLRTSLSNRNNNDPLTSYFVDLYIFRPEIGRRSDVLDLYSSQFLRMMRTMEAIHLQKSVSFRGISPWSAQCLTKSISCWKYRYFGRYLVATAWKKLFSLLSNQGANALWFSTDTSILVLWDICCAPKVASITIDWEMKASSYPTDWSIFIGIRRDQLKIMTTLISLYSGITRLASACCVLACLPP